MDELLFTPVSVFDLLSQIDELSGVPLEWEEDSNGNIQLKIGQSSYTINANDSTEIEVAPEVIDVISDVTCAAYDEISAQPSEDADFLGAESVQSGILKEIAKSLLLGGMIRLSAKLLK